MKLYNKFHSHVRVRLAQCEMNQTSLAGEMGVDVGVVSNWLCYKSQMYAQDIFEMWWFTGSGNEGDEFYQFIKLYIDSMPDKMKRQ